MYLLGIEGEESAESADVCQDLRSRRRLHQRLDHFDKRIAGIDIDAGVFVGSLVVSTLFLPLNEEIYVPQSPQKSNSTVCEKRVYIPRSICLSCDGKER